MLPLHCQCRCHCRQMVPAAAALLQPCPALLRLPSSGYVRLSRKLRAFLEAPNLDVAPKIRRSDVITMLERVRSWLWSVQWG